MRKGNAKRGIVVGLLCMVLAVVGIVAYSSEVQPVDSVSTDHEALPVLNSNLTNLSSVVIDERGASKASETSDSAVELYLEHQKNIVNASGWNEYIISITNPNEVDIRKTIYLEGTRYNWDATGCWVRDADFDGKIVATLENMTVHPGDTVQVTVPVQLKATGERNFYIFEVRGGIKKGKMASAVPPPNKFGDPICAISVFSHVKHFFMVFHLYLGTQNKKPFTHSLSH